MIHFLRRIELHPMGGFGEKNQIALVNIIHTWTRHAVTECKILHTPHHQGWNFDAWIFGYDWLKANDGAIPVDHGSHCARLGPSFLIVLNIFIREGVNLPATTQCTFRTAPIVCAHTCFGKPWQLKEKDIPRAANLFEITHQKSSHHSRMRHIHNAQAMQTFRIFICQHPSHSCAPIMPYEIDLFISQRVNQTDGVFYQCVNFVTLYAFRFVAQVISTLVRDNDPASSLHQRGDLFKPSSPIIWKSV